MARNPSDYIARKPRHPAADPQGFPVEVQRAVDRTPGIVAADLINLSRDGFQLRAGVRLAAQEPITLRLRANKSEFQFTLPATVVWQQPDGSGWLLGCSTEHDVAWETMGELFLNGILAAESA